MAGVVQALSECYCCGRMFFYNPHRVPSIPVHGVREPICRSCVDAVNPRRVANGLEPIVPLPGAYEPMDEADWIGTGD